MPIYEYECEKCRNTFEMIQPISAEPLKFHGENGCKGRVRRLVSASGFILKGSGWYATDYPSESRKQGWKKEQKQANTGSSAAPAKGDSGPASSPADTAPAPPKPAAKKPSAKNPYSGGSRKKIQASP
ncbi:MAG: FmdB family zinc ribbon protein [Nitrospinaceae bacterium]